jgi:phage baseplate assembly protein W
VPQQDAGTRDFLGRGAAFPFGVDASGAIRMSGYEEHVAQAVRLVLGTARGERVMRPQFGIGLYELAFAPLTASTAAMTVHIVREALLASEPRIDVLDVRAEPDHTMGRLLIEVEYRVHRTDTVFNLVYPFYVERGRDGAP